jgi:hypothetical protein
MFLYIYMYFVGQDIRETSGGPSAGREGSDGQDHFSFRYGRRCWPSHKEEDLNCEGQAECHGPEEKVVLGE